VTEKTCTQCGLPKLGNHKNWCRSCLAADARARRQADPDTAREAVRRYRAAPGSRQKATKAARQWRKANPEKVTAAKCRDSARLRDQVFGHYGRSCACCGTTENLSIDHVNGDGAGHREELFGRRHGGGDQFYRWLVKNGFPAGFQTLCLPCNQSKQNGEQCRLKHIDRQFAETTSSATA